MVALGLGQTGKGVSYHIMEVIMQDKLRAIAAIAGDDAINYYLYELDELDGQYRDI
ncbi:MAG: hypothetical protein HC796_09780 [Synechococcaceae cyanobacterium RL_1_2]|nr:hypothetical protein [Synechococcaceae cyanobacterium RL_1_2]